ncbi:hypothetical protein LZF95_01205 [Algoriphagus sp. AGSA1]|uniref:hypothetical protein n=1 Tax=Algoriphagus sp. AGSA1 TaxID=2907213 RepID=UPI001F295243|nr:hypothetical protein [Algoriphagus sp. AGSA1]MCE7053273.1 hypothetical protein [Algoriphagus sp. AGSA1]
MNKYLQAIVAFVIILLSLKFFEVRFLGDLIGIKIPFLFVFVLVLISIRYFFACKGAFVLPVQLLTFSMLFSVVSAYLIWQQGLMDSLVRTIPLTVVPVFFLLHAFKFQVKVLENVIIIFGYFYFVLSIFQLLNPETAYFGHALVDETGGYAESRGVTRVIFPGGGIFWLACFISLSKLISNRGNKYVLIPLAIYGLVVPVLQATRQLIAFIMLLYFLHFGFQLSVVKKVVISILIIISAIYIGTLNLPVFEGIYQQTMDSKSEGTKYIRFITGAYYLTEFSDTVFSKIMGNGVPSEKSYYGTVTMRLIDKGMYLEDVGIIGLYSQAGIFAVIAWIIIWYKSFTVRLPKEYYYCKYYLWMILFTSLTSGSIYNVSYAISTALVLFIFNQVELNKKNQLKRIVKLLLKKKLLEKLLKNKELNKQPDIVSPA